MSDFDSDNVSILINQGEGTFADARNLSVGVRPVSLAVSDFNNDGRLGLAVVNEGSGSVSIFLGNGDGTFQPRRDFPLGSTTALPSAIAAADFNEDNCPDLAVTDRASGNVFVSLGNCAGRFGPFQGFRVGSGPASITTGDFDGDGHVDLAVANSLSRNISVLFGNGRGSFSCPNNFAVGPSPVSLVADDFDLDTRLDLAVSNTESNNISVMLNNRPVSLEPITPTTGGVSFQPAISGDGDKIALVSDRDLISGNPVGNLEIFLWTRDFGFTRVTYSTRCTNTMPSISADGARIAFTSNCDLVGGNPDETRQIFLAEVRDPASRPTITQITSVRGGSDLANIQPSISGDGRRIAFSSNRFGNHEIFLWTQGTGIAQITRSIGGAPIANSQPSINRDGTVIAFSSNRDLTGGNPDGNREIFRWREGSGIVQITRTPPSPTPDIDNFQPSISADGLRIAFSSNRDLTGRNPNGNHEIFLWKQDLGFTQITFPRDGTIDTTRLANSEPSISAIGSSIAFKSNRDLEPGVNCGRSHQIFLWREGVGILQVTVSTGEREGVSNRSPSLNIDGTRLIFNSRCYTSLPLLNRDQAKILSDPCDGEERIMGGRVSR